MLISIRHLLDRARHPHSRADDLAKLRARFAAAPSALEAGAARVDAARELRALRREMAETLSDVHACTGCAKGHPEPAGHWNGGHCCGGGTFRVFTPEEVTVLKWGGTVPSRWVPPAGDHAGCAFRGPTGCSLEPEDRPTICLRYVCIELRAELKEQPRWRRIADLNQTMMRRFAELFPEAHLGNPTTSDDHIGRDGRSDR